MAEMTLLQAYLALERRMVQLDQVDDSMADEIRDQMDPMWHALSDGEREALDRRSGDPIEFAGSVADTLWEDPHLEEVTPVDWDLTDRVVNMGLPEYPREPWLLRNDAASRIDWPLTDRNVREGQWSYPREEARCT